jgi:hypothetical protein
LVFLSPSLNHNTLNFCLQHTSKRIVFYNLTVATFFLSFSSPEIGLYSSTASRPFKSLRRSLLFFSTITKH